jgi:hypothetical protein
VRVVGRRQRLALDFARGEFTIFPIVDGNCKAAPLYFCRHDDSQFVAAALFMPEACVVVLERMTDLLHAPLPNTTHRNM